MSDILHEFPIRAQMKKVFEGISTPAGLDRWWTRNSAGTPSAGAEYELGFGPGYSWRARVTRCVPDTEFELKMTSADSDWTGTSIGFRLDERDGSTWVSFRHTGWKEVNGHFRISSYCWAMYLRVLTRFLERAETVQYEDRLKV
ncbi:MAG TPA: SRPBCC domain-containing protein [Bacteroidota bacterium]|nr:SRPBCC domain-containing protein [Bacteroidota bacterium]